MSRRLAVLRARARGERALAEGYETHAGYTMSPRSSERAIMHARAWRAMDRRRGAFAGLGLAGYATGRPVRRKKTRSRRTR